MATRNFTNVTDEEIEQRKSRMRQKYYRGGDQMVLRTPDGMWYNTTNIEGTIEYEYENEDIMVTHYFEGGEWDTYSLGAHF